MLELASMFWTTRGNICQFVQEAVHCLNRTGLDWPGLFCCESSGLPARSWKSLTEEFSTRRLQVNHRHDCTHFTSKVKLLSCVCCFVSRPIIGQRFLTQ